MPRSYPEEFYLDIVRGKTDCSELMRMRPTERIMFVKDQEGRCQNSTGCFDPTLLK